MRQKRFPTAKLLSLLALALLIGGVALLFYRLGVFSMTREQFVALIDSYGAAAPLAFIFITFLQVTFVPIPSTVTILGGSYLFGALPSFFYSYVGLLLGAVTAFWLGRLLGKRFVLWIAGDNGKIDALLLRAKDRELVVLFFMFLLPAFPDDLLCLLAGLLPISFTAFLVMQLITRLTSIGATLLFFSGEVIPFSGWGIPVLIGVGIAAVLLFVFCFRYASALSALFDRITARLARCLPKKSKEKQSDEDA